MEFAAANHSTYKMFTGVKWDLYEEKMALVRDAHQWAMVAMTILEERMEWMSHSTASNAPAAAATLVAATTLVVTDARSPGCQDIKKKIPR